MSDSLINIPLINININIPLNCENEIYFTSSKICLTENAFSLTQP